MYNEVEVDYFGLDFAVNFGIWSTSSDPDQIKDIFDSNAANLNQPLRLYDQNFIVKT